MASKYAESSGRPVDQLTDRKWIVTSRPEAKPVNELVAMLQQLTRGAWAFAHAGGSPAIESAA
jgi:hypothetical protein